MTLLPRLSRSLQNAFLRLAAFRSTLFRLLALTLLAACAIQARGQTNISVTTGWNLLGNGSSTTFDVTAIFGDPAKVFSVWKWVPAKTGWAFYAPSLAGQALIDYAAGKGYDVLTTITGGEGFWVNANTVFTATLPAGTAITSGSFRTMPSGWNLICTGDDKTPSEFNALATPTTPLTTLWAWDAAQSNWYFYAPSLEALGGSALVDYITSRGYLNFVQARKTLGNGLGFWVNVSSTSATLPPLVWDTGAWNGGNWQ